MLNHHIDRGEEQGTERGSEGLKVTPLVNQKSSLPIGLGFIPVATRASQPLKPTHARRWLLLGSSTQCSVGTS